MKWEYEVVYTELSHPLYALNMLGQEGWELVSVVNYPPKVLCVFKRPVRDKEQS